jgi:hypothetical protein
MIAKRAQIITRLALGLEKLSRLPSQVKLNIGASEGRRIIKTKALDLDVGVLVAFDVSVTHPSKLDSHQVLPGESKGTKQSVHRFSVLFVMWYNPMLQRQGRSVAVFSRHM